MTRVIQVSTVDLIEGARTKKLDLSFDKIMEIWTSVGKFIKAKMLQGRAVRIDKLGIIGFDSTKKPLFWLSTDFERANRVKRTSRTLLGSEPTVRLNAAQIADEVKVNRDSVKKFLNHFLLSVNQHVKNGESLQLSILPIGEFQCIDNLASFKFRKPFLNCITESQKLFRKPVKSSVSNNQEEEEIDVKSNAEDCGSSLRDNSTAYSVSGQRRPSVAVSSNCSSDGTSDVSEAKKKAYDEIFKLPVVVTTHEANDSAPKRSISVMNIIERIKPRIVNHGGLDSINALGRLLRSTINTDYGDESKNHIISIVLGLRDVGVDLSTSDVIELRDCCKNQSISTVPDFMTALRGNMAESRINLVLKAFSRVLAAQKNLVIKSDLSLSALVDAYDVAMLPEVLAGRKSTEKALMEFKNHWDYKNSNNDGVRITEAEFLDYYWGISSTISSDDYFELLMRNAWHVSKDVVSDATTYGQRYVVLTESTDEKGLRVVIKNEKNTKVEEIPVATTVSIAEKSIKAPKSVNDGNESHLKLLKDMLYDPPVTLDVLAHNLGANRVLSNGAEKINTKVFANTLMILNPSLDRKTALKTSTKVSRNGFVDLQTLHSELQSRYGRIYETGSSVIDRVRSKVLLAGGECGLNTLENVYKSQRFPSQLSKEILKRLLNEYGVSINFQELDHIMSTFDTSHSNTISFTDFIKGMRGGLLPESRRGIIEAAFNSIKTDKASKVTLTELYKNRDFSLHPGILSGKLTEKKAKTEFIAQWKKMADSDSNNNITLQIFTDYYTNISPLFDGDEAFEFMMRDSWCQYGVADTVVMIGSASDNTEHFGDTTNVRGSTTEGQVVSNKLGIQLPVKSNAATTDVCCKLPNEERLHRMESAKRVQATFRGHQDRKYVASLQRKAAAEQESKVVKIHRRPRIKRAALRTTHGF